MVSSYIRVADFSIRVFQSLTQKIHCLIITNVDKAACRWVILNKKLTNIGLIGNFLPVPHSIKGQILA